MGILCDRKAEKTWLTASQNSSALGFANITKQISKNEVWMFRIAKPVAAIFTFMLIVILPVFAQEATLSECRQWQEKINYYTKLRKAGGSVRQMESWKRQRGEYEEKFRRSRCQKYGKQVK